MTLATKLMTPTQCPLHLGTRSRQSARPPRARTVDRECWLWAPGPLHGEGGDEQADREGLGAHEAGSEGELARPVPQAPRRVIGPVEGQQA